jgi:PKD repeat protein
MPTSLHFFPKKIQFLLILLFFCGNIFAQIETNNWYFGKNAGIDFNNNQVNLLNNSAMNTIGGSSSISDKDGALLFYTNGQTVWNKNHQIMENGTELVTDTTTPQTSIIIPKPGNENVYYIFTTLETYESEPFAMGPGVYYSEVTFSDAFPLGQVTVNSQVIYGTSSSKLTAIHHPETNSIRVITFGRVDNLTPLKNRTTFYIFEVTTDGVQFPPVVKTVEQQILGLGTMKISPNGKRIAVVDDENRYIYFYDFNPITLDISLDFYLNPDEFGDPKAPYSVEFSQNSEWVYFSAEKTLYQYNLEAIGDFEKFPVSQASGSDRFGTLQLASNGKIYIAKYRQGDPSKTATSISVINNPNQFGEGSNFEDLDVSPNASLKGLPNFISSYFRNRILTENRCIGADFEFDLDLYKDITAVSWDFGDGTTSTALTPTHQFTAPGTYVVQAMITINNYPQPLYKTVEVFPLPKMNPNQVLKQCDSDNDGISNFSLNTIIDFVEEGTSEYELDFYYSRSDAEIDLGKIQNDTIFENTSNPQELYVKITSPKGCISFSNFFIQTTFTPLDNLNPIYTCEDSDSVLNNGEGLFDLAAKELEIRTQIGIPASSIITFYASILDAETKVNSLPLNYTINSSTIWIRVDKADFSCGGIGTFQAIVNASLGVDLEDEYQICNPKMQPPVVLNGGNLNDRWEWKNESGTVVSTNKEFKLLQSGTFSLTVYRTENTIECSVSKEFVVI